MECFEIEQPYDLLVDKDMQKQYYIAFGRKHRVSLFFGMLLAVVYFLSVIRYATPGFREVISCLMVILVVMVTIKTVFWTSLGIFKYKHTILRMFRNSATIKLRITMEKIQLINGGCEYNLLYGRREGYTIPVYFIIETERHIFIGRDYRFFLCYIEKKDLSKEQYEFVTTALVKAYGKRYKQVM